MRIGLQLIRARPESNTTDNNANISLRIGDSSLYTRGFAKKRDMLAYSLEEFNYLEILAKTFIIPARQNQLIQETFFPMLHFVGMLLQ